MILPFAMTAGSGVDPGTVAAISTACGVVGAALVAGVFGFIQSKTRRPSDARDDRTVEVATAKSAAEVAMELVETTKSWAMTLIGELRAENTSLIEKNATLAKELADARAEVARLVADRGGADAELAAARERERSLTRELAAARQSLDRVQGLLNEAQRSGIEELTLIPSEVRARAARMDTGPTTISKERRSD